MSVSGPKTKSLITPSHKGTSTRAKEAEEEQPTFTAELKELMYGFGDKKNPNNSTAELLQNYVVEYIQNLSLAAYRRSRRKGLSEIALKDLLYVIKNDKKRFYRTTSLINFYYEVKNTLQRTEHRLQRQANININD